MASKVAAKAAVDAAGVAIKADIDAILPAAANITDGKVTFNPTTWTIRLTAPDLATAQAWSATIQANLTTAARAFQLAQTLGRRSDDGPHGIVISTALCVYQIVGF